MLLDRIPVRLRLSLGHAIWMALLFAGIGIGLHRLVQHNLFQAVDAALLTSAKSIRDARFVRGFNAPLMESFLSQFFGEKFIRPYAQLVDLSGRISNKTENVRVSLPVTPTAAVRAERGLETFETFSRKGQAPIRQITLPVMANGTFTRELIQVGAPLEYVYNTLTGVSLVLWTALPAGLLLSVFFGYLLTARSLKPVKDLTCAAGRMSAANLGGRLALPAARDELRALAQTFNAMLDRLEDAFKRLRRFSGDVSHELRTPLAVLRGEAELALRRRRTPEEYETALRTIVSESATMTETIEELLLLARAESKSVAMHWQEIHTETFIKEVMALVEWVYEERGIKLLIVTSGARETFMGSPGFLSLALKNVLLNASKHSANGGTVEFEAWHDGIEMNFAIRDQGEGIPEADQPYIFDPFYRADTARNRAAGGTGIGLSLALAMVRLHNGTIRVSSKPGQGATFIVTLGTADSKVGETEEVKANAAKHAIKTSSNVKVPAVKAPQPS